MPTRRWEGAVGTSAEDKPGAACLGTGLATQKPRSLMDSSQAIAA